MKISRDVELKDQVGMITLRPPVRDDIQACFDAVQLSMAEIMPWMNWCQPDYSIDLTIDWVKSSHKSWVDEQNYQFAIIDSVKGQFRVLGQDGSHRGRNCYRCNKTAGNVWFPAARITKN